MGKIGSRDIVVGGRPYYGFTLGVVLLDVEIPRPRGDIGNAQTFSYPVDYKVAHGLEPSLVESEKNRVVRTGVVDAAKALVRRGARAIGTSCGLLAKYQSEVVDEIAAPVATSSLLQVPLVLNLLPRHMHVGVVTAESHALTPKDFTGTGLPESDLSRVHIAGMEQSNHFYQVISGAEVGPLDLAIARDEVFAAVRNLVDANSSIAALVLECANLGVYSPSIRAEFGLPVWDAKTMLDWLVAGYDDAACD